MLEQRFSVQKSSRNWCQLKRKKHEKNPSFIYCYLFENVFIDSKRQPNCKIA